MEPSAEPLRAGNAVQSCDVCRIKKRRCDLKDGGQRCSSCIKSNSVCQITHVNKPREKKKKKQMENLEDRLKSLEELIKSSVAPANAQRNEMSSASTPRSLPSTVSGVDPMSSSSASLLRQSHDHSLPLHPPISEPGSSIFGSSTNALFTPTGKLPWTTCVSHRSELLHPGSMTTAIDLTPQTIVRGDRKCFLPPAEGGFFLLQEFLMDFNAAMPIFDHIALGTLFHDCYDDRCDERPVSWVVLKVVLAIAHRLRAMSPMGVAEDIEHTNLYLGECLSGVHRLLLDRPSLLLCQCYIALAMAFSMSPNQHPATMFASVALRVALDLRINDASYARTITSKEQLQEQRVFWAAYLIDADLSLRAGRVPSLSPKLISIALPSETDEFAVGEIISVEGGFRVSMFRLRVELALMQAELMELLQTPDTLKFAGYDGDIMLQALLLKLGEWRTNWLFQMTVDQLQSLLHRSDLVHVIVLESAYFSTLHALLAQQSPTPTIRTRPFSADALMDQVSRPTSQHPHGDARRFVNILRSLPGEGMATYWLTLEAMIAALAVIFSFVINNPREESAESDLNITQPLLHILKQLSDDSTGDDLAGIQNVCVDLYVRAEVARRNAQ